MLWCSHKIAVLVSPQCWLYALYGQHLHIDRPIHHVHRWSHHHIKESCVSKEQQCSIHKATTSLCNCVISTCTEYLPLHTHRLKCAFIFWSAKIMVSPLPSITYRLCYRKLHIDHSVCYMKAWETKIIYKQLPLNGNIYNFSVINWTICHRWLSKHSDHKMSLANSFALPCESVECLMA